MTTFNATREDVERAVDEHYWLYLRRADAADPLDTLIEEDGE
jgi:hypothetical protein